MSVVETKEGPPLAEGQSNAPALDQKESSSVKMTPRQIWRTIVGLYHLSSELKWHMLGAFSLSVVSSVVGVCHPLPITWIGNAIEHHSLTKSYALQVGIFWIGVWVLVEGIIPALQKVYIQAYIFPRLQPILELNAIKCIRELPLYANTSQSTLQMSRDKITALFTEWLNTVAAVVRGVFMLLAFTLGIVLGIVPLVGIVLILGYALYFIQSHILNLKVGESSQIFNDALEKAQTESEKVVNVINTGRQALQVSHPRFLQKRTNAGKPMEDTVTQMTTGCEKLWQDYIDSAWFYYSKWAWYGNGIRDSSTALIKISTLAVLFVYVSNGMISIPDMNKWFGWALMALEPTNLTGLLHQRMTDVMGILPKYPKKFQ